VTRPGPTTAADGVPAVEDRYMTNGTRMVVAMLATVWVWRAARDDRPTYVEGECPVEVVDPDYGVGCRTTPPDDLSVAITRAADEFDVDPWMVAVTVHRESGCDQYARGSSGEIGLAQVNPSVWMDTLKSAGIARRPVDLYDVRTNLRASAYILSRMLDAADGDLFGTFRRYNGSGPKSRKYAREQVYAYTTFASTDNVP